MAEPNNGNDGQDYEVPLQNRSVRAQIRDAILSKLNLFWPSRDLGMLLIVFDPNTGEIITTSKGDPQHVMQANERIKRLWEEDPGARIAKPVIGG